MTMTGAARRGISGVLRGGGAAGDGDGAPWLSRKRTRLSTSAWTIDVWNASEASCFSCSGFVMKPISTSTAGMLAPTRTRNGAC